MSAGGRRLISSPAGPMVVALLAASVFVLFRLESYGWNPTGFVHAGDRFVNVEDAPDDLIVRERAVGFDGTGFYRLALNPLTRDVYEHGIVLDLPAFRHQRILYPVVVWAVSGGGRPSAVGWGLIAVNLASFAAIGWLGAALARRLGRSPWWGLALAAYPGFAVSLGLDTAEVLAAALGLAALLALERDRFVWASALFTGAMLTRETTLLFVIGITLARIAFRRPDARRIPAHVFMTPLLGYLVLQLVLWWWWGTLPLRQGSGVDITFPLVGVLQAAPDWPSTSGAQAAFQYVLLAAIALFVFDAVRNLPSSTAPEHVRIAAGCAVLLALLLSDDIWLHHWGFLRAFTELYLLGAMVLIGKAGYRLDRLAIGAGGLWTAIAVNLTTHP